MGVLAALIYFNSLFETMWKRGNHFFCSSLKLLEKFERGTREMVAKYELIIRKLRTAACFVEGRLYLFRPNN
jgi:hypothetical protein